MDLGEIIGDAIAYPIHNVKSLIIYMIIGIIGGILGGASLIGVIGTASNNALAAGGFGIIGVVILAITGLLITGYGLDIVKFGIERRNDAPGIDFVRQVLNAIKLFIVTFVYYIIPAIISWLFYTLLGHGILTTIIVILISIVFTFAEFMGVCRLAKYDSLIAALAVGEAIGDITKVGMLKVLITIILVMLIAFILMAIIATISGYNGTIGGILFGIIGVYLVFFSNRAVGLLYSDA